MLTDLGTPVGVFEPGYDLSGQFRLIGNLTCGTLFDQQAADRGEVGYIRPETHGHPLGGGLKHIVSTGIDQAAADESDIRGAQQHRQLAQGVAEIDLRLRVWRRTL